MAFEEMRLWRWHKNHPHTQRYIVGCDFDKETVKMSGVKWTSFAKLNIKGPIFLKNRHFLFKKGLINGYVVLTWS